MTSKVNMVKLRCSNNVHPEINNGENRKANRGEPNRHMYHSNDLTRLITKFRDL